MNRLPLLVLGGACVAVVGILADLPFVVAVSTLVACGAILLALLAYFAALPDAG